MGRSAVSMALLLLVGGCGAAEEARLRPAGRAPGLATATVLEAGNLGIAAGDDALRYVPPLPDIPAALAPPREEAFRLAGGQRVTVVERREVPIVNVAIHVRWTPSARGVSTLAGQLWHLMKAPGSAHTVIDALWNLGAECRVHVAHERALLETKVPPSALDEALRAILGGLDPAATLEEATFEATRQEYLKVIAASEGEDRFQQRVDEAVFVPGHLYRVLAETETASVRAMTARDVLRLREEQLRPEAVSLAFVGAVSAAEVRASLASLASPQGALAAGKAPATTPARGSGSQAPVEPLTRGLILVEEPGRGDVDVAVVVPLHGTTRANLPLEVAVQTLVSQSVKTQLGKMVTPGAWVDLSWMPWRLEQPVFQVLARVGREEVVSVVRAVTLGIQAVDSGSGDARALQVLKVGVDDRTAHLLDSGARLAHSLAHLQPLGLTLEGVIAERDAARTMGIEGLQAKVQAQVRRGEMRVVVMGNVKNLQQELSQLGLTPVSHRKGAPWKFPKTEAKQP